MEYIKSGVDRHVSIKDDFGRHVEFIEDPRAQLKSMSYEGREFVYKYDLHNHLISKKEVSAGATSSERIYHYEVNGKEGLLTGITDERGIRFATWDYDWRGRAISSEHNGGAGRVEVTYNSDSISSVVNELGKATVYRFEQIGGVKRITSIEGEPSSNCPASNSSFTYNDRGLILTKTDAKGLITTYAYNDRGLEVSRTEASGTTLARTVTTEWDPDRFLPIRVTEPDRITTYSYDVQGRELSRQTTSR
ncbi:RHS repeat protein [Pseudomonas alliivorans]|nr:RHS repeat protein [Pseudomonas alliivorans]